MKRLKRNVCMAVAVLLAANIFSLAGCGKTEGQGRNTDMEGQYEGSENQTAADSAGMPEQAAADGGTPGQTAAEGSREQGQRTSEGSAKTQKQDAADCSEAEEAGADVKISGKTQAEIEAEDRAERAMFEEKVKDADGVSEEEAIEIARRAMEADLGRGTEEMKLSTDETYGWSSDLCIADWNEIQEEDRGAIVYCINFNNAEEVADFKDLLNYNCTVNAVDGKVLEAYLSQGLDGDPVYYEH